MKSNEGTAKGREELYNNLKRNKFVVVPGADLLEDAQKMSMPYFSIIEIPIKKFLLAKQGDNKKEKKNIRASYSKHTNFKEGSINLFWQINDESFKHMKKKVQTSGSTKVRKFKFKNEAIMDDPSIMSEQFLLLERNEINQVDDSPTQIKSRLLPQSSFNSIKPSPDIIRRQSILIDKIKTQVNNDLASRIYRSEYEKLKQHIKEESVRERELKKITDLVKAKEGAVSAKPSYKFTDFQKRMSKNPSFKAFSKDD